MKPIQISKVLAKCFVVIASLFIITSLEAQTIKSIDPDTVSPLQNVDVYITGENTVFTQATTVAINVAISNNLQEMYHANTIQILNDTLLIANFTIRSNTGGSWDVHVDTMNFNDRLYIDGPFITSVSPTSYYAGHNLDVFITGQNTTFSQATNVVITSPHSVIQSANHYTVISDTLVIANFTFEAGSDDFRNVHVGLINYYHGLNELDPFISFISPDTVYQNENATFSVSGKGTLFTATDNIRLIERNYTSNIYPVTNVTVIDDTTLTASFNVSKYFPRGLYSFEIDYTSLDSTVSLTTSSNIFIAKCRTDCPENVTMQPDSGVQGDIIDVFITGTNTDFLQATGVTMSYFSQGTSTLLSSFFTDDITVVNDTALSAQLEIPNDALIGWWNLIVGPGPYSWANSLYVDTCLVNCPAITSLTPDTVNRNEVVQISITGSNTLFSLVDGEVSIIKGNDRIVANDYTILNDASMTAEFDLFNHDAIIGLWDVVVGPYRKKDLLYVDGCDTRCPYIKYINPDIAAPGDSLDVYISGGNTHFSQATSTLRKGNKIISANQVNILNDSLIKASYIIPLNPILGDWDLHADTLNLPGAFYIGICRTNCAIIQGNVFNDLDQNCVQTLNENGLLHQIIRVEPGPYFGLTDSNGSYSMNLNPGSYTISQVIPIIPNTFFNPSSCSAGSFSVTLNSPPDTTTVNFPDEVISCPLMSVEIFTPRLRLCVGNTYYITYRNTGIITANNAFIEIEFDSFLSVTASSIPWRTPQSGKIYVFDLGNVAVSEEGSFSINAHLSCSAVLRQTHCVSAHIYPDSICIPPDLIWDGSSITVDGGCNNQDSVSFRIMNKGNGDMSDSIQYYVIEDNLMLRTGKFLLQKGTFFDIWENANGSTYRVLTKQSDGHPGDGSPTKAIEGCGTNTLGQFSLGFVTQFPEDESYTFVSIDCQENIRSWDPNDKFGFPKGVGPEKFILAETALEYKIRFQNTGTDTAFKVVIRDTLSSLLDITTIEPGTSSHPHTLHISGENILTWTFDNILLPDSNINELGSHGFVTFRIGQNANNAEGAVIENAASIYFDYNAPVKTNVEFHTIGNPDQDVFIWLSVKSQTDATDKLLFYPNPMNGVGTFDLGEAYEELSISINDISGRLVYYEQFQNTDKIILLTQGLKSGTYLFRINTSKSHYTGKIVLIR